MTGDHETVDVSVRVCAHAFLDVPKDFCGGTPIHSNQGEVRVPFVFWLISGPDAHWLVDCGVPDGPRPGGAPAPLDWHSPALLLTDLGIARQDIDQLILTHLHRDHCGNLDEFEGVPIVLQLSELVGWEQTLELPERFLPLGEGSWIRRSIEPRLVQKLRQLAGEGGVTLADGDFSIAPGVELHLSRRGHSFGIQWLSVATPEGPLVIAGDAAMLYSNLEEMWPSGYCHGDQYEMLLTYGEILDHVDGDLERVIPGHDPDVFERFPSYATEHGLVAEVRVALWDRASAGLVRSGATPPG